MTDLLTRLEALDGPSREVDAEIAVLVRSMESASGTPVPEWADTDFPDWRARPDGKVEVVHSDGRGGLNWSPLRYTESTDAALTLPGAEDNLREAIYLAAEVRGPHGKRLGEELARELCRICIAAIEAHHD